MRDGTRFVSTMVGDPGSAQYEIGPGYWFVKDYFLYAKLAWMTFVVHVGDIKPDETKNLKISFDIPLEKKQ